jgi:hypothetical protein
MLVNCQAYLSCDFSAASGATRLPWLLRYFVFSPSAAMNGCAFSHATSSADMMR